MIVGGTRSLAGRLGRVLEQRIFDRETGPHPPESFIPEYAQFEERSEHVTIVDELGIVGTARNIYSPTIDEPTKLEVDLRLLDGELRAYHRLEETYGSPAITELATMVVEPRGRHREVTGWLFGEVRVLQQLMFPGAPSCSMSLVPLYRALRMWGVTVDPLVGSGPVDYLGASSQPTFFAPGRQEQLQSSSHFRLVTEAYFGRLDAGRRQAMIDLTTAKSSSSPMVA